MPIRALIDEYPISWDRKPRWNITHGSQYINFGKEAEAHKANALLAAGALTWAQLWNAQWVNWNAARELIRDTPIPARASMGTSEDPEENR